jgi:hypothetical protein
MNGTTCNKLDGCRAPICPLDSSFQHAVWYPGEPICNARGFKGKRWNKIQKRIDAVSKRSTVEGCFTEPLMEDIKIVRDGIKGLTR